MPQSLLVNRQDFSDIVIVNQPDETLKPDHIRVSVGPWALTANNITSVSYTHLTLPTKA